MGVSCIAFHPSSMWGCFGHFFQYYKLKINRNSFINYLPDNSKVKPSRVPLHKRQPCQRKRKQKNLCLSFTRSPATSMGRPWVKERTRRLSWRSERRLRSLLCCQQQRGKILLQGDSVVKVTKSFPAFPSSNYSTTGMVELEVQFPVYFCVFCR